MRRLIVTEISVGQSFSMSRNRLSRVRAISHHFAPQITRWQAEALVAIQEAAEEFLVKMFGDAMLCATHAKRICLFCIQGFNNEFLCILH
ncbi:hypothetical protein V6N13_020805 [Hibiscus sabdariffa]